MNKYSKFIFPFLLLLGSVLLAVQFMGVNVDGYNEYSDSGLFEIALKLIAIGGVGSLITTIARFGLNRLKLLLGFWIAAVLLFFITIFGHSNSVGDGILKLFIAILIAYAGSVFAAMYSFFDPKPISKKHPEKNLEGNRRINNN